MIEYNKAFIGKNMYDNNSSLGYSVNVDLNSNFYYYYLKGGRE